MLDEFKLIELVQCNEILYKKFCRGRNTPENKRAVWANIAEELQATVEECIKRWTALRDRYGRELKRRNASTENGTTSTLCWPFLGAMDFLKAYVKPRTSIKPLDRLLPSPTRKLSIKKQSPQPENATVAKISQQVNSVVQAFGQMIVATISQMSPAKQAKAIKQMTDLVMTLKLECEDEIEQEIPLHFGARKKTITEDVKMTFDFIDPLKEMPSVDVTTETDFQTATDDEAEYLAEACEDNQSIDQYDLLDNDDDSESYGYEDAKTLPNKNLSMPLPDLTDAQNLEMIAIYKSFPCLWDTQDIDFRCKDRQQETIKNMLKIIQERMHLIFTESELKTKIYRIRYVCSQQKLCKLQCERSGEDFAPICKYSQQIAFLEDNVGPFKCPLCEQAFKSFDQYSIHKAQHDGSMPFTCPLCSRGYKTVPSITVHLRRHTRNYPYECEVCKKRFATMTEVKLHMSIHTDEKPYVCDTCGQSFKRQSHLRGHMQRHQKRYTHACSICSRAFYDKTTLTDHMNAHLNVRDHICNVCGKGFTCGKLLRQHKLIHAEKKKYVCKICSKGFAQCAGLSGHMKTHGTTMSGTAAAEERC